MINTYSSFLYDFTINSDNKYLDFKEGAGAEITAVLTTGDFTLEDLMQNIEDAMNEAGGLVYTVTANRTTRIITITVASSTMNLLASTGTNVASSVFSTIGFAASDSGDVTSKAGATAIGTVYEPQYKLQDYVDQKDSRKLRDATVQTSSAGLVRVHSFGTDRMFEFSIKFATDIYQPSSGPIVNNQTGVDDLRAFMQFCIQKKSLEFMPDKNTPTVFYRVVLESTADEGKGTGYKLLEQYAKGLVGYFETGILKFRIIED